MAIFNKKIKENFDYEFEIKEDGIYTVEIVASCKSWWQNLIKFTSFFKDDDLTIKIDDVEFPKLNGKRGLFDAEAAWNGNNLKGLKKTDIFLIKLEKGNHLIHFLIDQEPYLESINIYKVQDSKNIFYAPESNNPPEDGNRRQWLNIILVNLSLKNFSITASAGKREEDDDDLKLIIDGEIQKNTEAKSHKYWFWCGRVLKGKSKLFEKELNLKPDLHYIEFWADRMPTLYSIKFNLGPIEFFTQAKVVWEHTVLREAPNSTAEVLVKRIDKDEKVVILEKAIPGERVKNDQGVLLPTSRWHKIKYQNQEGYIYSMALEIEGEDKQTIQQIIITEAKAVGINAEILLALADCESNSFPYTVSFQKDRPEVAFGVMQLTDDLIKDLNNVSKSFYSPVDNAFDIRQNIRAGVRYFNYLYNNIYKNAKDRLKKAVAAYNAGYGNVPVNQSFNLAEYGEETKRIVPCVENHLRNKTFQKILSAIKIAVLATFCIIVSLSLYKQLEFNVPSAIMTQDFSDQASGVVHSVAKPMKFPAVVLDAEGKQLNFFNHSGNIVKQISIERLNKNSERLFIDQNVLEYPDNSFYFIANLSSMCNTNYYGGLNCANFLYQFNVNNDRLELIDKDIYAIATYLYLSPDASKLAIVRDVMKSICTIDSYLTILNLTNLGKKEFNVIGEQNNYDVNSIKSLNWQDSHKITVNIERYNQDPRCLINDSKLPRKESKNIFVDI